jgi:endonuclease/exonuclease/phosphatase family metal-dependent hydrolase
VQSECKRAICFSVVHFKCRTLTVGVFKRKDGRMVIHLNTHLDVFVARARREQARLVREAAKEYGAKFPDAFVVVTGLSHCVQVGGCGESLASGDFNMASGQAEHEKFLSEGLFDAFDHADRKNVFASSFHGWMGSFVNSYAARFAIAILHSLHASGVDLPRQAPSSLVRMGCFFLRFVADGSHKIA